MKNRLHDKKAGIPILVLLIILSLAEIIFRAVAFGKSVLNTSNVGEQITIIILATIILIMTIKGKDRLCYICYGAWVGYFVLDQSFELPGMLASLASAIRNEGFLTIGNFGFMFHTVSMIGIIIIGALLVEYMNDGTIYNKAFNISCIFTVLTILASIITNLIGFINGMPKEILLAIFNNIYRVIMIFLFTFFAYDSAKKQLSKVDFDK